MAVYDMGLGWCLIGVLLSFIAWSFVVADCVGSFYLDDRLLRDEYVPLESCYLVNV